MLNRVKEFFWGTSAERAQREINKKVKGLKKENLAVARSFAVVATEASLVPEEMNHLATISRKASECINNINSIKKYNKIQKKLGNTSLNDIDDINKVRKYMDALDYLGSISNLSDIRSVNAIMGKEIKKQIKTLKTLSNIDENDMASVKNHIKTAKKILSKREHEQLVDSTSSDDEKSEHQSQASSDSGEKKKKLAYSDYNPEDSDDDNEEMPDAEQNRIDYSHSNENGFVTTSKAAVYPDDEDEHSLNSRSSTSSLKESEEALSHLMSDMLKALKIIESLTSPFKELRGNEYYSNVAFLSNSKKASEELHKLRESITKKSALITDEQHLPILNLIQNWDSGVKERSPRDNWKPVKNIALKSLAFIDSLTHTFEEYGARYAKLNTALNQSENEKANNMGNGKWLVQRLGINAFSAAKEQNKEWKELKQKRKAFLQEQLQDPSLRDPDIKGDSLFFSSSPFSFITDKPPSLRGDFDKKYNEYKSPDQLAHNASIKEYYKEEDKVQIAKYHPSRKAKIDKFLLEEEQLKQAIAKEKEEYKAQTPVLIKERKAVESRITQLGETFSSSLQKIKEAFDKKEDKDKIAQAPEKIKSLSEEKNRIKGEKEILEKNFAATMGNLDKECIKESDKKGKGQANDTLEALMKQQTELQQNFNQQRNGFDSTLKEIDKEITSWKQILPSSRQKINEYISNLEKTFPIGIKELQKKHQEKIDRLRGELKEQKGQGEEEILGKVERSILDLEEIENTILDLQKPLKQQPSEDQVNNTENKSEKYAVTQQVRLDFQSFKAESQKIDKKEKKLTKKEISLKEELLAKEKQVPQELSDLRLEAILKAKLAMAYKFNKAIESQESKNERPSPSKVDNRFLGNVAQANRILRLNDGEKPDLKGEHKDPRTIYLCVIENQLKAYRLVNGDFAPYNIEDQYKSGILNGVERGEEIHSDFDNDKFNNIASKCGCDLGPAFGKDKNVWKFETLEADLESRLGLENSC